MWILFFFSKRREKNGCFNKLSLKQEIEIKFSDDKITKYSGKKIGNDRFSIGRSTSGMATNTVSFRRHANNI